MELDAPAPLPPARIAGHRDLPVQGLAMATLTILCWASAFPAIRIAVRAVGPMEVAFIRALSGSLVLGSIALSRGMRLPRGKDLAWFALLGIVGHSLYTATLSLGQTRIPSATAAFLISSAPLWMVVIARIFHREQLSGWAAAGLGVSLSGVLVISLGRAGALTLNVYALVVLAAALLQAAYSMGQRPFLARYTGLEVVTWCVIFAGIAFLPWAGRAATQFAHAPLGPRIAVLYLGVVPTAVGYWTWADTNRHLPASVAGSFLYLVPALALFFGWVLLGETPTALSLGGGALVVGGVAMVQKLGI